MTILKVKTAGQVLVFESAAVTASGSVNTVKLQVTLDALWTAYAVSAVFFTKNKPTVYEVILAEGECTVPHEVLTDADVLFIGIRGVNSDDGSVLPSTLVQYRIQTGAPAGDGTTEEPTPDVYQQLLTAYGEATVLPADLAAIICPGVTNPTVKDALAALLPRNGKAAMTGNLSMDGHKMTGLGVPTADGDAVNLGYANDNFAPAGYGLGAQRSTVLDSEEALDATMVNGWYYYTGTWLTKAGVSFGSALVHVKGQDKYNIRQEVFPVGTNTMLVRHASAGVWEPFCCENHPMAPGVEYRTTERCNGEVVYRKLVSYATAAIDASATNKDINIPHGIANFKRLVYCLATKDSTYQFPYLASSMGGAGVSKVDTYNIVFRVVHDTYTAGTLYFDIKYTKTT